MFLRRLKGQHQPGGEGLHPAAQDLGQDVQGLWPVQCPVITWVTPVSPSRWAKARTSWAGVSYRLKPPTMAEMGWPGKVSATSRTMLSAPPWQQLLKITRPLGVEKTRLCSWEKSSGSHWSPTFWYMLAGQPRCARPASCGAGG